jgi:hypothetical protein
MSRYIYIGSGGSNEVFATYWEATSSASGTVTLKAGSEVLLDAFQGLEDAVVSQTSGGKPTFEAAVTAGGTRISATFDSGGNYTLSGTPSSYPVAIVWRVILSESDIDYNNDQIIIEDIERPGGGGSGTITGGANLGTGEGIFADVNGGDLRFKSLKGEGINVTSSSTEINLSINSYMPGGWG